MSAIESAKAPPATGFRQRLGLFDAIMLVAGTMIGSGIFIVSADIARDVGATGWLLGVWALTGVLTVIGALSYAELAAMMPHAGGQYVFLREAYGPLPAFLYGWTSFLVIQTGTIAAVAVAFGKFLGVLVPALGTDQVLMRIDLHALHLHVAAHLPWMKEGEELVFFHRDTFTLSAGQFVGLAVIVFLTRLNCRGVEQGKWVQNIFGVAKILALLLLIGFGLIVARNSLAIDKNLADMWDGVWKTERFEKTSSWVPFAGLAAVMVAGGAMVGSLFSADAWGNVTYTASEVRNPRVNLPLSLVCGTGLVILLYLLANGAYLSTLPMQGDAVLADRLKAEKAWTDAADRAFVAQARYEEAYLDEREARAGLDKAQAADASRKGDQAREQALLESAKKDRAYVQKKREQLAEDEGAARSAIEDKRTQLAEEYAKPETVSKLGISQARDDRVGTAALQEISPHFGVPLMAVAIMISTFGCVNGLVLMGARLYYAMARDGLFFASVGGLNTRGVPAAGLGFQCVWASVLLFSGTYSELLDYVIFAALLFYVVTVVALFVLRRKLPNAERPYRAFGYPWLPGLYVGICTALMLDLLVVRPIYSWPSFLIILSGIPAFFFWRWLGRRRKVKELMV